MKRLIDIIVALIALMLLTPLYLLISYRVYKELGTPIIFKQPRPGLNGKTFFLLKFRSMADEYASDGSILPDSERLSPFGRKLRSSSLDELPSLWNVIKGDMSLVGPRPLLVEYLPLYNEDQSIRHNVRPGITGWAQVNGRNAISWQEKFALDAWYVQNQSFWLDIKILFLTVYKVIKKSDINADGEATMTKFTGNNE